MMVFESLAVSFEGPVAHLRLTRPALNNYVDLALHRELPAALTLVGSSQGDVAALIISAEGPHFMAGVDLDMVKQTNRSLAMREQALKEGFAIINGILDLPYPVIAAVQGAAIGLGASIISCCDIIVAARSALISDPHVMLGVVAGDGGIMGWSQSIGIMRAKRYLLTGDPITAEEAHAMGMVTDLVDLANDVLPAARALADKIAKLPRAGVRGTKRAFSRLTRQTYESAFELAFAYEMQTMASEEVGHIIDVMIKDPPLLSDLSVRSAKCGQP